MIWSNEVEGEIDAELSPVMCRCSHLDSAPYVITCPNIALFFCGFEFFVMRTCGYARSPKHLFLISLVVAERDVFTMKSQCEDIETV